ncbi:MAG: hypothetical protein HQL07_00590 [Nitrospirae bacterium]|nr:hypothetical protein [Magnetococcales bacterium]
MSASGVTHTPGPWTITRHSDGSGGFLCVDRECVIIAETHGCDTWAEEEANITLIAAAPDLLRALENLTEWLGFMLRAETAPPKAQDFIRKWLPREGGRNTILPNAWDAIRKAKGVG